MKTKLTFALIAFLSYLGVSSAYATTPSQCGSIPSVTQRLQDKQGQVPIFSGFSERGGIIIIIYANKESNMWSAGTISPGRPGIICFLDSGVMTKLPKGPAT